MSLRSALRHLVAATAIALLPITAQAAGVLHRGNGAEPETLDPQKSTGVPEANLQRDLFEGLVTEAADGKLIPGAATAWTASEDGLTYRFTLRPDGKWSDGTPVTSEDFVWSWRRLLDPAQASKYAFMLWPLKNAEKFSKGEIKDAAEIGVKAEGPGTLVVTLERPTPYLIGLLAHHASYPVNRKAIETHGDRWTRPGNLVGNGAFTLAEWTPQDRIRIDRSKTFHDAANVALDSVYYYPTEDIQAEYKRYRAGELDITYLIPPDQIAAARRDMPNDVRIVPYFGTYYYALNLTRAPFKDNVKLRQALSLAIDRDAIVEKVAKAGEMPAYAWVPPNTGNYRNPAIAIASKTQGEREAMAKTLLAEAGFGPGKPPVEVEILYNTNDLHKRVAIAVAAMWEQKLGVKAKLVNQEWKVYLDMGREMQFDVRRAAWIGDYDDAWSFLELLKSDVGKQNPARYENPAYDDLLRRSAGERDLDARARLMAEAEVMMLNDVPIIPIWHYVSRALVKPYVKGRIDNVQDFHPSRWMSVAK